MTAKTYPTLDDAKRAAMRGNAGYETGPYAVVFQLATRDLDVLRNGGAVLVQIGDEQAIVTFTPMNTEEAESVPFVGGVS